MKIFHKLVITAVTVPVLALIVISLFYVVFKSVTTLMDEQHLANTFHSTVSELNILTYEYLFYQEERMETQWLMKYREISSLIENAKQNAQSKNNIEFIDASQSAYEDLGKLFLKVVEIHNQIGPHTHNSADPAHSDNPFEERLIGRMLILSQEMITYASRYNTTTLKNVREVENQQIKITAALMLIYSVLITIVLLIVGRSIIKPLNILIESSRIIGKGDFHHTVGIYSKDETGQLARSFNEMSRNLMEITASRDELNLEIQERKKAEERVTAALKEKETLLQEIHHRVKNNLQIVASLLQLQLDHQEIKEPAAILKESIGRIYAMSAIHESFYQTENLSEINFNEYLLKLTRLLTNTYSTDPDKLIFEIDTPELILNIEKANPLGLILNELISNSIKYAFPDGQIGTITIKSDITGSGDVKLIVSDDGIGMPEDFDRKNIESLGLRLVNTIIEGQLHGSIQRANVRGTCFIIRFNIVPRL